VPPGGLAVGMPARMRRAKNDAQPPAAPSSAKPAEANTTTAADTDTTSSRGGASPATERDVKE